MVQHCVNAASTDFSSYTSMKQRDAADVVGNKASPMNNALHHHIRTLGSMQAGSVDFVSKVLPVTTRSYSAVSTEPISSDPISSRKTNTTASSSSSSGYESVLSHSSKSHKSIFYRLKRLIKFPSTKISANYPLSTKNHSNDPTNSSSPVLGFRYPLASSGTNSSNETGRKSSRRTLALATQHIPFLYGLKNCGNTCYINAIVQCLCHTEQLASYILRKSYEIDIRNVKNALTAHSNSSQQPIGFKVTKIFVQIFQALWNNSSNTTSKLLYDFKTIVGNLNKQYSGNEQNDAQEFLLFLINTIHDELNLAAHGRCRQTNKNSVSSVTASSSSSIASSDLARRAWSEYTDTNQSIITSTFSAQLHSTLRCNQCKKESKTFEPYLLLSLPIPQKIIKPVFITVVFLNQSPKQLQIGLCLPITNTVRDVREAIAQQSNLDPNDLVLVEIQQHNGFSQVFHDTEPITRLAQDVYAVQFPSSNSESTEHVASTTDNSSSPSYVNLLVLNRVRYNSDRVERFGSPIAVRVPRQSNYRELQLSIIKAQRSLIRDEAMEYAQDYVLFQLTLVDQYQTSTGGTSTQEYPIIHDVQLPLYLEKIVEILDTYDGPGLGPSHIQAYANWHEKYLEEFLSKWTSGDDKPDVHQSVTQARATLHQPSSSSSSLISLADCFSLFTQSESLNHDDAWMCTHCRRKENGTVKNLKIWTTPPVLIIHLKRFCQTKMSNSKLTYPVQFPLLGLNVKRFLSTTRNLSDIEGSDSDLADEQEEFMENDDEEQDELYDLFAVCNHRGSMSNGHYTAYCKNSITSKWFCYDDHLVSELEPSRVCTPDAYILFYKRRDRPPPASSAQSIQRSPSTQQHIDFIANDFDIRLNLDQSSPLDDKKPHYTLQPPLPLPRKLLTPSTQDECSSAPCPMPRTRLPQYDTQIISQPTPSARQQLVKLIPQHLSTPTDTLLTSPWSRFNDQRYSNDEPESNVVYHPTISR